MTKLYYSPPSDTLFEEVKEACISLWKAVDTDNDKYGYATSKINAIKDIKNVGDNFMYMVAMFDPNNQESLSFNLSGEANKAIIDRLIDGGQPEY